jgi:hypothetical protein
MIKPTIKSIIKPVASNALASSSRLFWKPQILNIFGNHVIGYWPLNETIGTNADDKSTNNYDATYEGTFTLNQYGVYNTPSVLFTSADLNIKSTGLAGSFNPNEGFIGVILSSLSSDSWNDANTYYFFGIQVDSNNRIFARRTGLVIEIYHFAGGTSNTIAIDTVAGTKWFSLGFRWSKSEGALATYINGVEVRKSSVALGNWVGNLTSGGLYFYSSANGSFCLPGYCSHAYLLNYAPTYSDIQKTFNLKGTVCFEGDSRSNQKGWQAVAMYDSSSPSIFGYGGYGFINDAVSGDKTTDITNRDATTNAKIISGKNNILVYWAGVNDGDSVSAATTYNTIKNYLIAARSSGWNKIIVCSEIDAQPAGRVNWHGTQWPALNTLLIADHSFADGFVNLGAITQLQDATNTTYFNVDKLHPVKAGYDLIGAAINTVLKILL